MVKTLSVSRRPYLREMKTYDGNFWIATIFPEWFLLNPVSLLAPARENGGNELAHAHSFCRCVIAAVIAAFESERKGSFE